MAAINTSGRVLDVCPRGAKLSPKSINLYFGRQTILFDNQCDESFGMAI